MESTSFFRRLSESLNRENGGGNGKLINEHTCNSVPNTCGVCFPVVLIHCFSSYVPPGQ